MKEGDRFAYDYNLLVRKAQAWTSLQYKKNSLAAFVAGRIGGVTMQRDGKMRNGVAEALGMSSYGKSGTAKFLEGGGKAGLTYYLGAGNTIQLGAGYELKAPQAQAAFVSPEVSNDFVHNLKNEKVFSSEVGYQFETSWMKANINGYYSTIKDASEWQCFFYDDIASFSYVSMTGMKKEYYGLEWGLNFKINSAFSIKTLGTISEAKNTNNADVVYMNSTEGKYYGDIVYNKNMREAGTPLSAYNLTLSYHSQPDAELPLQGLVHRRHGQLLRPHLPQLFSLLPLRFDAGEPPEVLLEQRYRSRTGVYHQRGWRQGTAL